MKYRKNVKVKTEVQALDLLKKYADFVNPAIDSGGEPQPTLDTELLAIHNSGDTLEWDEETQVEYDQRIKQEESDAEEIEKLKSDHEYFLKKKVRPLRDSFYVPWHNYWNSIPALWAEQTDEFIVEAEATRQALKDFPASITEYMTDEELKLAIMELKPYYITE